MNWNRERQSISGPRDTLVSAYNVSSGAPDPFRTFLSLQDPDPELCVRIRTLPMPPGSGSVIICTDPCPFINKQKIFLKNLDFNCFWWVVISGGNESTVTDEKNRIRNPGYGSNFKGPGSVSKWHGSGTLVSQRLGMEKIHIRDPG